MTYSAKELFKDWYAQGTKREPSASELAARRESIVRLVASDDINKWLTLVKLFYGIVTEKNSEVQFLIDEVRKDDADLSLRNSNNLFRVIAGCAIAQKIEVEENTYLGDTLCLALLTTPYAERTSELPLSEVIPLARVKWLESCAQVREASILSNTIALGKQSINAVELSADASGNSYTVPATFNANNEKIKGYLQGIVSDIKNLKQPFDSITYILNSIDTRLNSLSEESNVFWWLYNSFSRDFDQPFNQLGLSTMCIVAPKELADLTISLPGLGNANALLYKALQMFEAEQGIPKLTFSSIIESSEPEIGNGAWLKTFTAEIPSAIEEVTPCLYAMQCYDTYDHEDSWKAIFKKKGKFAPDIEVSPIHFAQQVYLELLLVRVYNEL